MDNFVAAGLHLRTGVPDDNARSFKLATQALNRGRKRFDDLEELPPRRVQRAL